MPTSGFFEINFNNILRFFKENYNRTDEKGLRWLIPGLIQLPLSLAMLAIGYNLENLETCSMDRDVSEVFVVMGFVMSLFAMNYIILGLLTQFKVKNCVEFTTYAYWPTVICTGITQFVLQTWAYNVLFGSVYYKEYNNKSCEKTPFISAIVILIIDTVYSFIVFIKMIYKMYKWCGSYGISKYSSSFLRRPQKFDDISHLI